MAPIPKPTVTIATLIDDWHKARKSAEPFRPHMGASQIGHKCDRYLWLAFRWAIKPDFSGRMYRLFRRGHREEEVIVSDLEAIGVKMTGVKGPQQRVEFGSHVGGSMDGIAESGIPGAPKSRHVLEFKTHSLKSFRDVAKNGVKKAKPQHWAQIQAYMLGLKINRALYCAACKGNDEYHFERVKLHKEAAQQLVERAKKIALADRMPEPMAQASPTWFECKWCDGFEMCHGNRTTKQINCRTCAHATATEESTFTCARYDDAEIPVETQLIGCECHVLHPDLVPWQRAKSINDLEAVYIVDGVHVRNGEACANVYSSHEMLNGCERDSKKFKFK